MESLHDYVVSQLSAYKGSWPTIARELEMPYGTLKKIANGDSENPGIVQIEKLAAYFRNRKAA